MKYRVIIAFLLLCFAWQYATAQTVKVISVTETTDFIPSGDKRKDVNKRPCALVKVQVVDDIDEVDGNVMGDIIKRGVEKWIYMAERSRQMTIRFKNNLPLKLVFRNYKIRDLKGDRIYEIVLDAPNKAQVEIKNVKRNTLKMKLSPVNAKLYLWGEDLQRQGYLAEEDGMVNIDLPYGRYQYEALAEDHEGAEGSVFVTDDSTMVVPVELKPIPGKMKIVCKTPKVDFYLDGVKIEKNPKESLWEGEVVPREYTVEARRKGYTTEKQVVSVWSRKERLVSFPELKKEKRSLFGNTNSSQEPKVQYKKSKLWSY